MASFLFWSPVFDNCAGGYGSPLVELRRVLEAVFVGASGGAAGGRGETCVVLALRRALVLSGLQVCDQGASFTVSPGSNSCRGPHGVKRWRRGVLVDKVGRLGEL